MTQPPTAGCASASAAEHDDRRRAARRGRKGVPAQVVFADLNGDGFVGVADLMILNGCVGSSDPDCCIADLDLDGIVGTSDRILAWASIAVGFSPVP